MRSRPSSPSGGGASGEGSGEGGDPSGKPGPIDVSAGPYTETTVAAVKKGKPTILADMLPELRSRLAPLEIAAFTDLARLARLQLDVAEAAGIDAAAAGHHAGEFETSILLALAPQHVRRDAFEAGRLHPDADAQSLFYPDLAREAPSGVVGDPRPARAERAERYLEAWVSLLESSWRAGRGG